MPICGPFRKPRDQLHKKDTPNVSICGPVRQSRDQLPKKGTPNVPICGQFRQSLGAHVERIWDVLLRSLAYRYA